jgi:GGDEF domain-containing protein
MPRLLQLADLVSRFLVDGSPRALGDLLAAGEKYCRLNARQLEEILAGLKEKVLQLADVLSIDVAEDADYGGLLTEAHRQLAEVAAEVAGEMVRRNFSANTPDSETEALLADLKVLSELISRVPDDSRRATARENVSSPASQSTPAPGAQARERVVSNPRPLAAETANARSRQTATVPADPGTLGQLSAAVAACRRNRCPLSLMLAELDDVDGLAFIYGVDGMGNLRRLLEVACRSLDHSSAICLPHGEAGFAVVLPDCDRSSAIALGHQLLKQVKHLSTNAVVATVTTIGVSIGVATLSLPPKNFPPEDLFEGAARCLYGSHASGGGVVKSIEIY